MNLIRLSIGIILIYAFTAPNALANSCSDHPNTIYVKDSSFEKFRITRKNIFIPSVNTRAAHEISVGGNNYFYDHRSLCWKSFKNSPVEARCLTTSALRDGVALKQHRNNKMYILWNDQRKILRVYSVNSRGLRTNQASLTFKTQASYKETNSGMPKAFRKTVLAAAKLNVQLSRQGKVFGNYDSDNSLPNRLPAATVASGQGELELHGSSINVGTCSKVQVTEMRYEAPQEINTAAFN